MFHGPMFPGGLSGVALLLGRLATASMLILVFRDGLDAVWPAVPLVLLAASLAAGFLTRAMAGICAALVLFAASRADGVLAGVLAISALHILGLALTGGGAYSLDARLFGRRVIRLDD
uniref:DoxX family protein n=1 Tax=Caulobacter sp. (strain K31) TaxID=366602 RepID=B0T7L8_CAUSK